MGAVKADSLIYTPETMSQALNLLKSNPGATIISGGTALPRNLDGSLIINRVGVSLHLVKELRRFHAGERGVELGAGATFGELMELKGARVPDIFRAALERFSSEPYRNLATLGGNLALSPFPGDLFLPLFLLGAGIEAKSALSTRWISAEKIWEDGRLVLDQGEVVTRVRIPEEFWSFHRYFAGALGPKPFNRQPRFAMIASTTRESLGVLRVCVRLEGGAIVRDRAAEESLSGQSLPLKDKESRYLAESLAAHAVRTGLDANSPMVKAIKTFVLRSLRELSEELPENYY